MSRFSVRARLTLVMTLLAAGLGVIAATLGVARVESDLVGEVIDQAGDEQVGLFDDGLFLLDDFEDPAFPDDFFPDDEEFLLEQESILVENLRGIDEAGALEELLDALDQDRDEGLVVLTNFGRLVTVDLVGGEVVVLPDDADIEGRVVSEITIDEIFFRVAVPDFGGGFFEEALGQGFGVATDTNDLRYAVTEADGFEFVVVADVGDTLRSVDRIRTVVWVATPMLALLGAAVTWVLTGQALKPVHEITIQVGRVSGGNLHERVTEPNTEDEIAALAKTMNHMLDRLELDDQRLRRFVSDASHELRSPVAVLRSEAEVALLDPAQTSVEQLADGVLAESNRLQRIVEDLLVLARGDESRSAGLARPVDLDDIVLSEAARRRRLPVDVQSVSAGRVLGTEEGCVRIVTHLLDNAARHGTGQIWVGLRTEDDTVTMWVDDDGPGVPPDERRRVFERFTRLDDARTRDGGGAGLGLAVVAETTAAMGGDVEIVNAPSGGARFALHWPAVID